MKKLDQLFLKAALTNGLLDETGVKAIAEEIQKTKGDASSHAVALDLLTQDQSNRLVTSIEAKLPPEGIPGYEILESIGRGATSTVWKARQESLGKIVALKVFSSTVTRNTEPEELINEARNVARLNHPHIVHALDAGITAGKCWFAMELVEGETLQQKLSRRGSLSERELGELALCITQGLSHAHAAGLLHRDLKPGNILISEDGVPKITDLGLALAEDEAESLNTADRRKGTPLYISPEQALGQDIDARSDLYSLGATLYHCITGKPPFQGKSNREILKKHVQEPIIPVSTLTGKPSLLDEVIEKLLEKEPDRRYQDAEAVITALHIASKSTTEQTPVSPPRGRRRPSNQRSSTTSRQRTASGSSRASTHSKNTLMTKIGIGVGVAISALMVLSAASKTNQGTPQFDEQYEQHRIEVAAKKIDKRMAAAKKDFDHSETAADTHLASILSQDQDIQIRALKLALPSHGGTRASAKMSVALDNIKETIVQTRQADGRTVLAEARQLASDGKLWAAITRLDDRPASARKDEELNQDIDLLLSNWEQEIDSRFEADNLKINFHRDRREFAEALALIDEIELYADPDNASSAVQLRDQIIMAQKALAKEESKKRLVEENRLYLALWSAYREKSLQRDIKGMVSIAVTLDAELIVDEVKALIETDLLAFSLLDQFIKSALLELKEMGQDGKEVTLERVPLEGRTKSRKDRGVVDRIDNESVWLRLSSENAVMPMKISELADSFLFGLVSQRHGSSSVEYRIPLGLFSMYRGLNDVALENFRIAEEKGTRPDTWLLHLNWVKNNVSGF
ncbi:MAG: protein kinase [Planctomycetota bacterium]|nr:protein kinase [Planctomycetota bacterium]